MSTFDPMEKLPAEKSYRHAGNISWRKVGDDAVLFDRGTNLRFSINSVGSLIWERIGSGFSLEDIHSEICSVFAVETDRAREQMEDFIQKLCAQNILIPCSCRPESARMATAADASSPVAIEAAGLGKRFQIGARSENKLFRQMLARLGGISHTRPLWAVRGVDLQVRRGECVGIIGRNGAGKTTLLQMLAGTLAPTEGHLRTEGRISTFLEIGSGLFSELRVIDNIRLTAALCGMSQETLRRRFDAIVAFGELEEYLYSRLGELSNGFQCRVPFSTALHSDIDILLTDEVFAVGDAAFSGKCVQRMQRLLGTGKTILIAAHDLGLIEDMCSRAIWLEHGAIAGQGPASEVVRNYLASVDSDVR